MNCPNCPNTEIRIFPGVFCEQYHQPMVCPTCFHSFHVKHEDKNIGLLPPEAELDDLGQPKAVTEFMKIRDEMMKMGFSDPLPDFTHLPTVDEMREFIKVFGGKDLNDTYEILDLAHKSLEEKRESGDPFTDEEAKMYELSSRWMDEIMFTLEFFGMDR